MLRLHKNHLLPLLLFTQTALLASQSALAQFSTILNIPPAPNIGDHQSIGSNTQVNLNDAGAIGSNFHIGTPNSPNTNIEVNIAGGTVGDYLQANQGSTINLTGGTVGEFFNSFDSSTVNIDGGTVGNNFTVGSGSILHLSAGKIGADFRALESSVLHVSGGSIGDNPRLTNGTHAIITGGTIGNLFSANSTDVSISGGSIGDEFIIYNHAKLNISGGSIGNILNAAGIPISMTGGTIGDGAILLTCNLKISAGSIGNNFQALVTSNIDINGGSIGDEFLAAGFSQVNLSGGTVGNAFQAFDSSKVNIFGTQFFLDGIDITPSLTTNTPFTITDRDVPLSGLLADGSTFAFDLNSTSLTGQDYFNPGALLNITLIQPGDFDASLHVDGLDFLRWQRGLASPFSTTDLANWETSFGALPHSLAAAATIPEPHTSSLLVLALVASITTTRINIHGLTSRLLP